MKNIIIIILSISPIWILAQSPTCGDTPSGFSTNPEAPYNPECSTAVNTFDWRTDRWYTPAYLGKEPSDSSVPSPFFNTANLAIPEIYRTDTYDGKDFEPEDGWELIMDGITQQQGNQTQSEIIYLALYNRYTATLRIFGAHYNIGDYDYAVIKLQFDQVGNKEMTGLLHPTQQIAQPLDQNSIKVVQRNSKLSNISAVQFFYADFPIGYDPCTCFSDKLGVMKIEFEVVESREITLYGRSVSISRTLEEVTGGNAPVDRNFLNNVHSTDGKRPDTGVQTFRTLSELSAYYFDLKNEILPLKEQYEAIEKVKKNLELAATLAAAVGVIGGSIVSAGTTTSIVLVNGVHQVVNNTDVPKVFKAAKQAKLLEKPLMGLAKYTDIYSGSIKEKKDAAVDAATAVGATRIISSEMAFDGDITNTSPRGGFTFYVPGQPNNSNIDCSFADYPMYNEVLGRFALLETPEVIVGETVNSQGQGLINLNKFQFQSSSFKYLYNPAARINEDNTKIFGALVVKTITEDFCDDGNRTILRNMEKVESLSKKTDVGGIRVNYNTNITPFVPIECLEQTVSEIQSTPLSCSPEVTEIYLRLLIMYDYDATGSDGNRIQNFEVITYPVKRINGNYNTMIGVPTNSNGTIPYTTTLGTTNFSTSQTFSAWETIYIDGNLTTSNGAVVEIVAPKIIVLGGRISPNIRLLERTTPFACSPINEFPYSNLSSYCGQGGAYQANQPQPKYSQFVNNDNTTKPEKVQVKLPFHSTPNPFTNTFNIEFELESESTTSLMVFDALGRVVETVIANDNLVAGPHLYQIDGSRLESGIYYLRLQTDDNVQTIKVMKQ